MLQDKIRVLSEVKTQKASRQNQICQNEKQDIVCEKLVYQRHRKVLFF